MKARLIEVIEVRVGSVRRYFTTAGESIGIVEDASASMPAEVAQDARTVSTPEVIGEEEASWSPAGARERARQARLNEPWIPPPFDPYGPRIEMGAPREGTPEADE